MEYNPLISVVIPTYNRPDHINRAIQSVLNQTYQNFEIIVIDDASEINVESKIISDKRIKVFKNSINKGPCYSRNKGLKEAQGRYINFLDDDDVFFSDKLQKQLEIFNESDDEKLGIVTCHAIDRRSGKKTIKYNRVKGNIYNKLISNYAVSGTETMLFKLDVVKEVGGFDEYLESSQEYDLLIRLSENYHIDYVNEVLCEEFRSVNQISINFDKKIKGATYLYNKHEERYREKGIAFFYKMRFKLKLLTFRFYIGKYLGEKVYRKLLIK